MRSEINLTDDQIEAVTDNMGLGVTIKNIDFTRETIADWIDSSKGWAERHGFEEDETEEGYPFVLFERAQVVKGQPRADIYVIDFGSVRAVVK